MCRDLCNRSFHQLCIPYLFRSLFLWISLCRSMFLLMCRKCPVYCSIKYSEGLHTVSLKCMQHSCHLSMSGQRGIGLLSRSKPSILLCSRMFYIHFLHIVSGLMSTGYCIHNFRQSRFCFGRMSGHCMQNPGSLSVHCSCCLCCLRMFLLLHCSFLRCMQSLQCMLQSTQSGIRCTFLRHCNDNLCMFLSLSINRCNQYKSRWCLCRIGLSLAG